MRRFNYLTTLILVFCIPTIIAGFFLANFISLQALVPFIVTVTVIGSIWDIWATRHGKRDRIWLWQFNRPQTIGIRLFGLPIEEYLFYVVSSVYVIFMWEGIKLIVATQATQVYLIVLLLAAWSLIAITLPYIFASKGDRFIN